MRIRLTDPDLVDDQLGFLQRSGCLVETFPDGTVEVYLPHDLPEPLARAEINSYLQLWARLRPAPSGDLVERLDRG
jgi:hypothetical protein